MEKKDMTMEARLLLAFVLMGLVLFGTQYFFKPPPATKPAATVAKAADAPPKGGEAAAADTSKPIPTKPASDVTPGAMPGQVQADKEENPTIDTDLYHVVFSNRGAVVKNWILKGFKDHKGQPLDLVNSAAQGKVPPALSLAFKTQPPATDPNTALFRVERSPDQLGLTFDFSDGKMETKKTFQFAKASYLAQVSTQVTQNGVLTPHSIEWRGGFGDETVLNASNDQHTLYYDLGASKLVQNDAKTGKNGPVSVSGQDSFAGLEDKYFAAVFLPRNRGPVEVTTYSDNLPDSGGKDEPHVGAAVGGDGLNVFSFFVGPKDTDLLKKVDPKLEQLIDWGWFEFIAKPLFLATQWTADHLVHNYGWAIIAVTVAVNLLLFPLRFTSMKSSKKMQKLQPQISAINAKYKNLSLRDPKKAEQNQEIMDLYKREGVNPVGGCLPMVLQLPFFYAFYKVLNVAIALRGATWLWVGDLSQPETLAIRVLPVLLIVTQFLSQKMTPSPGVDPSQQKMMMIMPLVLGYMFYFSPSGLVLYWLTGNLVGIGQQLLLNRGSAPVPAVVDVKPSPKRKK
jgi:YidC/Oxa1 family membrane protein insertase